MALASAQLGIHLHDSVFQHFAYQYYFYARRCGGRGGGGAVSDWQPSRDFGTDGGSLVQWWFDMKIAWNYWINICSNWAQAFQCLPQSRGQVRRGWGNVWQFDFVIVCVCVCDGILLPKRIRHDWLHWAIMICSRGMFKCLPRCVLELHVYVCVWVGALRSRASVWKWIAWLAWQLILESSCKHRSSLTELHKRHNKWQCTLCASTAYWARWLSWPKIIAYFKGCSRLRPALSSESAEQLRSSFLFQFNGNQLFSYWNDVSKFTHTYICVCRWLTVS